MLFIPELLAHFPCEIIKGVNSGIYSLFTNATRTKVMIQKTYSHPEIRFRKEYTPSFLISDENFSFMRAQWTESFDATQWTLLLTKEANFLAENYKMNKPSVA